LILLAFLFPLGVYCLILGFINRSTHPVLIRGTWDFLGVLFAASGFLLLGGPAILNGWYEERRLAWALGHAQLLPGLGIALWALYFTAVGGGSGWLLWSRRHVTVIYNVDPASFEDVLAEVLKQLKMNGVRAGNIVLLGQDSLGNQAAPQLEIEAFPAMHHVTLHWRDVAAGLRGEVEAELDRALGGVCTPSNPAGLMLFGVAACLFALTCFGVGLFLLGVWLRWYQH
jgi:hypothetical protein